MPALNPAWPGARFRNSFTQGQGMLSPTIFQARVVGVNVKNWTVDVQSWADRKRVTDLQVGSPYIHYSRGEGIYVLPEVGAVCTVTVPSDSSPPYVSSFLMPFQTIPADDADNTTSSSAVQDKPGSASFGGGRELGQPGDIVIRGRDNNFIKLHRGGVLQIGCSEVAQRFYLPLMNQIVDSAERYQMMTAGGSIQFALSDVINSEESTTFRRETFRVYANEEYADIRITTGHVADPTAESLDTLKGEALKLQEFGIGVGAANPFIFEVVVARNGFSTYGGNQKSPNTGETTVIRYAFDRSGNVFYRAQGNVLFSGKKRVHIEVKQDITVHTEDAMFLSADKGVTITAPDIFHVKSNLTKLGAGAAPAARQGDMVQCIIAPGALQLVGTSLVGTTAGSGAPLVGTVIGTVTGTITGIVLTGSAQVLI